MAVKKVEAVINGQTYTLTLNSATGEYEATITAPAKSSYNQTGHYYPVTVEATDDAGNVRTVDTSDSSIGSSLQLKVEEKTAPVWYDYIPDCICIHHQQQTDLPVQNYR